ncbi:MAG: segregation/condensation protein A [Sphaerochaeta sp.]|jgi:segregation and condensation protein A|nr:segregation/condensation protein A [Sphaerochaeta sp.]MCH3920696.1 segregation/condensation protein A [Sphaerochaeta sp.]MCI2128396.1 segregation/condensation protein A [Sphaerochaeta sp.]
MADADIRFTTNDGKNFHSPSLKFDGPLELLLYMIQQSEMNIYDIPIAQITDQFIDYLSSHQDMDLGTMTSFYKMAAELLSIKSRMLLPVDVEFDEEYEDPRQELVEQLIEYQKFKKYTQLLETGGVGGDIAIARKESAFMLPFSDQDLFQDVTLQKLLETFTSLMRTIAPNKVFNVYESVTVSEKIALMDELFETKDKLTLEDVIVHMDSKLDIVCSFMAILECCKLQKIVIHQEEPYGTIMIIQRPQDFDASKADEIDDQYDEMVEHGFQEEDNFSTVDETEQVKGPLHDDKGIKREDGKELAYDDEVEEEIIPLDDDKDGA